MPCTPRTAKVLSHQEDQQDLSQDRPNQPLLDPEDLLFDEHGGEELSDAEVKNIMRGL